MSLSDFVPLEFIELFSNPNFQKALKGYNLYLIEEDPEYRTEMKNFIEECIVTSELKPIKRISNLETVTGLNDFSDFEDEEHELTIPEQITILSEKLENLESKPASVTIKEPETFFPETKTEARAVFLVEHLKTGVKERNGELFLNGNEIKNFLVKIIPERYNPDFQVKKDQNIRKIKKDVLEKAAKLFPGNILINKSKNGRKETRVLFRPAKPLQTVTS